MEQFIKELLVQTISVNGMELIAEPYNIRQDLFFIENRNYSYYRLHLVKKKIHENETVFSFDVQQIANRTYYNY